MTFTWNVEKVTRNNTSRPCPQTFAVEVCIPVCLADEAMTLTTPGRGGTALVERLENRIVERLSSQGADSYLGLAHPGLDHGVVKPIVGRVVTKSGREVGIYRHSQ
jgi:hypothetical protein